MDIRFTVQSIEELRTQISKISIHSSISPIPSFEDSGIMATNTDEIAATKIQSIYRGHAVRSDLETQRQSATKIQAIVRGHAARSDLQVQQQSATKIQAIYRGHAERSELESQQQSATKIQAIYRGHATRSDLETQRQSATTIQAIYRGHVARSDLETQQQSAIKIQSQFRGHRTRNQLSQRSSPVHNKTNAEESADGDLGMEALRALSAQIELKFIFQYFDTNGDSNGLFQALKILLPDIELKLPQSGAMNFDEFLNVLAPHMPNGQQIIDTKLHRFLAAFQSFDDENQGFIDINDLRQIFNDFGIDVENEEIDERIKRIDQETNGKIHFKEYLEAGTACFSLRYSKELKQRVENEDTAGSDDQAVDMSGSNDMVESDTMEIEKKVDNTSKNKDEHDLEKKEEVIGDEKDNSAENEGNDAKEKDFHSRFISFHFAGSKGDERRKTGAEIDWGGRISEYYETRRRAESKQDEIPNTR